MNTPKPIILIAAIDQKRGLGKNGVLAHSLKQDMQFFKQQTSSTQNSNLQNAVIMGRKTWESIPPKFRPLPNRVNYILTRQPSPNLPNSFSSLEEAIQDANQRNDIENIFIIGGSQIYNLSIQSQIPTKILLTQINHDYDCDVFLEDFPEDYKLTNSSDLLKEGNTTFKFLEFQKTQSH